MSEAAGGAAEHETDLWASEPGGGCQRCLVAGGGKDKQQTWVPSGEQEVSDGGDGGDGGDAGDGGDEGPALQIRPGGGGTGGDQHHLRSAVMDVCVCVCVFTSTSTTSWKSWRSLSVCLPQTDRQTDRWR